MNIREEIQALGQNFCVTAGAGAGKTTCLKDTYLGLLRQGLRPGQIVAITFTEKAAEELRQRVVRAVAELSQDDDSRDWRALLPQVEWAQLTTIHSFCASLLREFGVLLGLDPDFAVVDADEFAGLLEETIQDVLRLRLSRSDRALGRLLAHYRAGIEGYLAQLYQALATDGLSPEQARAATGRAHEEARREGPNLVDRLVLGIDELRAIHGEGKINAKKEYGKNIKELLETWPASHQALRNDFLDQTALNRLDRMTKGAWYAAKPARDIIRPAVDKLLGLAALPLATQLSDDILDILSEVAAKLATECQRRAWLSFDDLLLKARNLLRGQPQVLAELRARWRVLLVDEFQDVNPVQGELVSLLAGLGQAAQAGTLPRLMVVGDRKQSIYAFRGADVTVFAQAMRDFPGQGGRVAALKENFRSQPGLVEFYNRLFEQVFLDNDLAGHAPLAFVDFSGDDAQEPGRKALPPEHPLVEVLEVAGAGDGERLAAEVWRRLEAKALARYLSRLLWEEKIPPGQIAVLFRRLTQIGVYEDALRQAGVPFYTMRGRGFYQCQEVADLLLALETILDPQNTLALAGFLRSPLVGLSDEALLALCYAEGPVYRGLDQAAAEQAALPAWLGAEQAGRWQKALGILKEFRPLARRLSPAELLENLLRATGIIPVLLAGPAGEQKTANLRKLLETARDPQGGLKGGVDDFVNGLKALAQAEPTDPQAPLLGEEAPVVRLMSVHQAKGLEFPVVILPDLSAGRRGGGGLPPPRGGVVGLKPRDPLTNKLLSTPVAKALADQQKAVEQAETARLFYVACTRARERLTFLRTGQSQASGWAKWVEDLVKPDPAACVISSQSLAQAPAAAQVGPAHAWPDYLPPEPGQEAARGAALAQRVMSPPRITPLENRVVRESVSGLEAWFACPRLYVFTRLLGLDTGSLPRKPGQKASDAAPPEFDPVALGSAVHQLLETADLWSGPAGLEPALAGLPQELAPPARALAGGIWNTALAGMISELPPSHVLREQPFRLWLPPAPGAPGLEVMGELDMLLVRPAPQPMAIVDYKVTHDMHPEHYRDQLGLYALALWSENQEAPPPAAFLCYLRQEGAELVELGFSAAELAEYQGKLIQAAKEIASLPLGVRPADLKPGPDCAQCALAGRGLCPEAG
ncbi:hypothetical protein AAU61_10045 [Desulfocarbo indianensis]|nr:hypothetical protein AAU61_10045 [Desulfocarbo indianensis]